MDDATLGIVAAPHYSALHDSPLNKVAWHRSLVYQQSGADSSPDECLFLAPRRCAARWRQHGNYRSQGHRTHPKEVIAVEQTNHARCRIALNS
jgi:hypothetical protein